MAEENDTMPEGMAAECYAAFLESEELSVMNEAVHADSFPEHNPRHSVTESDDDAVLKKLDSELTDIIMRTERLRDELPPV